MLPQVATRKPELSKSKKYKLSGVAADVATPAMFPLILLFLKGNKTINAITTTISLFKTCSWVIPDN